MNRYSFIRVVSVKNGHEAWIWWTWAVLIFITIAFGFGLMGYVSGKREVVSYYHPTVQGLIKQTNDKCTSTPWQERKPKNANE